jgi:hypothetical protein
MSQDSREWVRGEGERLTEEEYQRILDLRRIYGTSGVSDYLGVNRSVVELVLIRFDGEQLVGVKEKTATKIRSKVRQYWKPWMSKHRDQK